MSASVELLSAGDARLAPDPNLSAAWRTLEAFEPPDEAQRAFQEQMLAFIAAHPEDAHRRTCLEGHLTASALILDHARERALLTFHRKLGRWLQLGGHCDGDANLAGVAFRECEEESGIPGLVIEPAPLDLDVHPIPARPGEPEHLHLDTRYRVIAPEGAQEVLSHESLELGWFTPPEARSLALDESVRRLFRLAFV